MGQTLGIIHLEAKFPFSCEPIKPANLCISKIQWWDKHWMDSPIPKGKNQKEERGDGSQIYPKPCIANPIKS